MMMRPLDVIVFCPLPPLPNGIADYFAEQLTYFSSKGRICVVIDNHSPEPIGVPASVLVLRLEEYKNQLPNLNNIPHMYHVGNNPDTLYMLPILLNRPGILIVHDLNLHYLIDLTNLSTGDKAGYQMALFNQYGSMGISIGKQLQEYGWKGKHIPEQLYMNESIIHAASQIIVHSQYSADFIGALGHDNVSVIPHHLSPEIRQHQPKLKMNYRGQLGLPGNKPIITSMGFIAKAKQIKAVLASLAQLKQQGVEFKYVLAGQCKEHEYDVFQDIADYNLKDEVIVTGFLASEDFFKYLIASDFIVNLRYPSGGESSGTLTRALGLGLACLVVNIGPFAEIPENCAIKLDYDDKFQESLTNALQALIVDSKMRTEIGLNARRWVEETHDINKTTNAYYEIIVQEKRRLALSAEDDSLIEKAEVADANFVLFSYPTHQQIINYLGTLEVESGQPITTHWWRNQLLPKSEGKSLLILSSESVVSKICSELYGYHDSNMKHMLFTELFNDENDLNLQCYSRFNVVLDAAILVDDPVRIFASLNRVLTVGAVGCVSLIWEKPLPLTQISLSRVALKEYWQAAGFSVEQIITGATDIELSSRQNIVNYAQEWAFGLTKRSNMVNLAPQPYYHGKLSALNYKAVSKIKLTGE